MIYDHVYNFKRKHLLEPPFGIPRDEIFASDRQEKEIRYYIDGYNNKLDRSHAPPVYRSLQCGSQRLVSLVFKWVGIVIGLTPYCSLQVNSDCISVWFGGGGLTALAPPPVIKIKAFRQNWSTIWARQKCKEN